eukprot:1985572-Rhodomonas_salina.1
MQTLRHGPTFSRDGRRSWRPLATASLWPRRTRLHVPRRLGSFATARTSQPARRTCQTDTPHVSVLLRRRSDPARSRPEDLGGDQGALWAAILGEEEQRAAFERDHLCVVRPVAGQQLHWCLHRGRGGCQEGMVLVHDGGGRGKEG